MTTLEFLNKNVFFTTRSYAFETDIALATASRQLKKLANEGAIISITRGVWGQQHHPYFSPYGAIPYLIGNEQGYLSFLSALHRHGVLSQIPQKIQIATTGHSRRLSTALGQFEFFHIAPSLINAGVEQNYGKVPYNIASPEKALIDTLHLSTRKGRRFLKFPELETENLNKKRLKILCRALPDETRRRVEKRLIEIKIV